MVGKDDPASEELLPALRPVHAALWVGAGQAEARTD
jgi:hypothetical protein